MQMSDVIADMLTRIRNANNAKHASVDIPASNMKKAIADILLAEGYIKSYEVVEDGKQGIIRITLKYIGKQKVIQGLRRVSKPGLRIYASSEDMPKVMGGLGIAIVSTSKFSPLFGKIREEQTQCQELVECLLPFPPAAMSPSEKVTLSL